MNLKFCVIFFLVGLLTTIPIDRVFSQKGNNNRDEQRENQRVKNAERSLADAKNDLGATQKTLRQLLGQHEKEEVSLVQLRKTRRQTREDVEDRLGEAVGIPKALKKARESRAELDKITAKVESQLAATDSWKRAKAEADQAKANRQMLLENVELEQEARQANLSKLSHVVSRPSEMVNEAVLNDDIGKKETMTLKTAQAELDECRKKLPTEKINSDPKVAQIEKEIAKQEKELKELDSKISKTQIDANKVQKRLVQAQLSLKNAKAADAADSNRNNNNKPKK